MFFSEHSVCATLVYVTYMQILNSHVDALCQVVDWLVVFLSAAVLAWCKNSSSIIVLGTSQLGRSDKTLMLKLMPEALCHLLNTEPWQQIAGKVCVLYGLKSHSALFYFIHCSSNYFV